MTGMRFELGYFQETDGLPVPDEKGIENILSNLSSQTSDPIVDASVPNPQEAAIPIWVWFLLIPVVLPLFLLLFRGKGAQRPPQSSRRLDLRTQPEGEVYRERVAPALAKPTVPLPPQVSSDHTESEADVTMDSLDDDFEESGGFEFDLDDMGKSDSGLTLAPGASPEPVASASSHLSTASVAVHDDNTRLSQELLGLRKELSTALALFEDGRVNDKLPHLEQELENSHERFRQVELQRKALTKQLEETELRNRSLSKELDLQRSEIELLESRSNEGNESSQKLVTARQDLETMTRDIGELRQAKHRLEQERDQFNEELRQERSAKNELARQCQALESRIADTAATDGLTAQVKTLKRQLGLLQDTNDSLSHQLSKTQVQIDHTRPDLAPAGDSDQTASARKSEENRKLLGQVQKKLREKLELIKQLKKQIADSSPV